MGHLFGLDLLRFFAAVMVVLFHFNSFGIGVPTHQATGHNIAFPFLPQWTESGWIGVQMFFVLSGYLIAQSAAHATWKTFISKRVIRIFPALWTCATLALVVRIAAGESITERVLDWLRTIVLSPKGPYIDGVAWTLVVEMVFYLFVCLWMAYHQKKGLNKYMLLDRFAMLLGLASALFIVARIGTMQLLPEMHNTLNWFGFKVLLLNHGVFFALGMTIFSFQHAENNQRTLTFGIFTTLVCLLEIHLRGASPHESMNAMILWLCMLVWMGFSILKYSQLKSSLMAFISNILGKLSYTIYLSHFALGMYLVPQFSRILPDRHQLLAVSLLFLTTIAAVVTYGPEHWGQRCLKKLLG